MRGPSPACCAFVMPCVVESYQNMVDSGFLGIRRALRQTDFHDIMTGISESDASSRIKEYRI